MAHVGTFATLALLKADATHGDGHANDNDDADLTDDGTGKAGTADYHGGAWALHVAAPAGGGTGTGTGGTGGVVAPPVVVQPGNTPPNVAFHGKEDFVEGSPVLTALNA